MYEYIKLNILCTSICRYIVLLLFELKLLKYYNTSYSIHYYSVYQFLIYRDSLSVALAFYLVLQHEYRVVFKNIIVELGRKRVSLTPATINDEQKTCKYTQAYACIHLKLKCSSNAQLLF